MAQPTNRFLILGIGFGALAVIIVGYIFMIYIGHQTALQQLTTEIKQKELDLKDVTLQVKELTGLQAQMQSVLKDVEKFDQMLPKEKEIASLLKQIEAIILEQRVRFVSMEVKLASSSTTNLKPVGTTNKPNTPNNPNMVNTNQVTYQRIDIPIKIKGAFPNVFNFFTALKKMSRLVTVTDFAIKVANEEELEVDITAQTYVNLQGGDIY